MKGITIEDFIMAVNMTSIEDIAVVSYLYNTQNGNETLEQLVNKFNKLSSGDKINIRLNVKSSSFLSL